MKPFIFKAIFKGLCPSYEAVGVGSDATAAKESLEMHSGLIRRRKASG